MLTVPAFVWRWGAVVRGVAVGSAVGLFLGALAWLDSGLLVAGLAVTVLLSIGSGIWLGRQTSKSWPGAVQLTGAQRVAVVDAVRRGEPVADDALQPAAQDYARALHAVADKGRPLRWLLVFVLVVAVASALWDTVFGSWGNAVVSAIYLVLIVLELFWYPRHVTQLLGNADRATATSR